MPVGIGITFVMSKSSVSRVGVRAMNISGFVHCAPDHVSISHENKGRNVRPSESHQSM